MAVREPGAARFQRVLRAWLQEFNRPAGVGGGFVPEIESLRGIAIALVFWFHADAFVASGWLSSSPPHLWWVSPLRVFVVGGHTGVTLFFILSGFLLSRPFVRQGMGGRRVSRSGYYRRRALRILPLYFVAVVVASVFSAHSAADLLRGLPYLAFLNSFGYGAPLLPFDGVWWSLATEVQFYLLLPLLPLLMGSPRKRRVGAVVLVLYATAYAAFATGRLRMPTFSGHWYLGASVFGRGYLFVLGGAAAWFCDRYGDRVRARAAAMAWAARWGADLALVGTIVCLGLLLQRVALMNYIVAEMRWPVWHLFEGLLWTVVLLLLLLAPLRLKRVVSNRWWSAIGLLSYSIYLIHAPLLFFCVVGLRSAYPTKFNAWGLATAVVMPVVAALCLGLSTLTYWTIERPFLKRKVRIS